MNPVTPAPGDLTPDDLAHLQAALALAEQARPICPPNPAVGCVIANRDRRVLAQGGYALQPLVTPREELLAAQLRSGFDPKYVFVLPVTLLP